jgi:hypothetical protein
MSGITTAGRGGSVNTWGVGSGGLGVGVLHPASHVSPMALHAIQMRLPDRKGVLERFDMAGATPWHT